MKRFSISLIAGVLAAFIAASAPAQMISTQYAKKLVLADASASLVPLTLKAPASLTGAYSLTFPASTPIANGYLLSANTSGVLSWVDPASYNFLTGVSHNATLTGAGTSGSPLGIDLSTANTWAGVQSFQVNSTQGNALVASVNAASNTINAASVGIGLTNAQVNDDLTITGGSVTNSPINNSSIGATTASTGRFTTITGTSLPSSSTSTNIVTSNGGALETRTATDANTASTLVLRDGSGNFSAGSPTFSGLTITSGFGTAGIVHNAAGGALSSSLIVNNDVAAGASIVDTKLATISTAGKVANSATTATNANTASAIVARDGSGNFIANSPSFSSLTLTGGTNQLVLGGTNNFTITAPAPNTSRTYTIPDVSANAIFALTSSTITDARIPKWNGTAGNLSSSGISDNGTTVSTTELVSVAANSANDALAVSNSNNSGSGLAASTTANIDGFYAIKGSATGSASNSTQKIMGVWGIAKPTATITSSFAAMVGVRAEGNATSNATNTNTALMVVEGGINIGRQGTTAANNGGTDLVNNSGEDDATAGDKGPSGVVALSALAAPGANSGNSTSLTVFNVYATPTSIIQATILNSEGLDGTKEMATVTVENRAAGKFDLRVFRMRFGGAGSSWTPRVGFVVINAVK